MDKGEVVSRMVGNMEWLSHPTYKHARTTCHKETDEVGGGRGLQDAEYFDALKRIVG